MIRATGFVRAACALALLTLVVQPVGAQSSQEFFEANIRPVLVDKCWRCHGKISKGGLYTTSREALLQGGDSGPAIVPGDPDASLLIRLVRHEVEGSEMPYEEPALSAREIENLVTWIRDDAPWPADAPEITAVANEGLSPSARIFVDSVRPLLTQRCFACHTDDESGGLRLDSLERMLEGGYQGPAIIPGNPEQSLLIAAVRHDSENLQMPRDGDRLSEAEIAELVEWVRSGAEWAEVDAPMAIPRRVIGDSDRNFWSFREISDPTVPMPAAAEWQDTDIDRFVAAKFEEKGLTPVALAERRRLIRRATYDLTGLPPTPEEVDAFLADDSSDAFEKLVDRLLASPHYGERWGRHWLDVVRFGEDDTRGLATNGAGFEPYPNGYIYRDWVIKSFNEDLPYDVFIKAQLAGDLIDAAEEVQSVRGLGFLGQGPWYYDLADPVIARADERHDRVDVTTRGFLGLTVGCARCHDHKYDPIGAHDYYALAGIFNNTDYHEYPLGSDEEVAELETEKEFIDGLNDALRTYRNTESEQFARVLTMQISRYMMAAWEVLGEPERPIRQVAGSKKVDLELLERYVRFLGKEPEHYNFLMPWQEMIADEGGTEERAQELADEFQRLVLEIVAEADKLEERNAKIIAKGTPLEETESVSMPNGFESFFDEHQLELESMDTERWKLYLDVFSYDLDNPTGTYDPQPALLDFYGWSLERQLGTTALAHIEAMSDDIKQRREDLPDIPFAMGVEDKKEEYLADIGLHIRGDPRNLGEAVPSGFPLVLSSPDATPYADSSGRLELANDIAAHPLAARVIVNRVWAWHLGTGIVTTPSNFGFAGGPPTNPELLEYLTRWFIDNGMSIKKLHKKIMLTRVYQLDTGQVPANEAIDGENFYFWRANRRRLEAEGIRDALLATAGNLDTEVGGKSLKLDDDKNDRRTVYGWVSRFQVDEYLRIFDFPDPNLSAERRFSTNVPLQSLYFMNNDFVYRQAQELVRRLADEASSEPADSTADAAASDGPASRRDRTPADAGTENSAGTRNNAGAENSATGNDARTEKSNGTNVDENADSSDDSDADEDIPEAFDDRAMIEVAYPLLYGRAVTNIEMETGLAFLTEQRATLLVKELEAIEEKQAEEAAAEAQEADGAARPAGTADDADAMSATRTASGVEADNNVDRAGQETATDADNAADAAARELEAAQETQALAERRASMKAWTQYARALFSAAEFRYID